MRLHYFQHVPFEGLALIESWAQDRGHEVQGTQLYDTHHRLPALEDYEALVVMGGPMGVYEDQDYPWLAAEKDHIRRAISAHKPVLGGCLGAQLIAHSLGATVKPHSHKEIGWYPITLTERARSHRLFEGLEKDLTVLHWHGDRFEIPDGALPLAQSEACDHQGFLYRDRVLGLQFHIEMEQEAVKKIIAACGHELVSGPFIQDADTILRETQKHDLRAVLFTLLDRWSQAA